MARRFSAGAHERRIARRLEARGLPGLGEALTRLNGSVIAERWRIDALYSVGAEGAVYVATICVVPSVIAMSFHVPFQFGGTSLMIVVGVALETVNQIEAHLISRSYEGLTGPRMTRLSGRRPA